MLRINSSQPVPQMRNMATQRDIRARRRRPAPQLISDPARGYAAIQIDQQQREQFALLAAAKLEPHPAVDTGGKRTEDAKPRLRSHDGAPQSSTSSAYPRAYHAAIAFLHVSLPPGRPATGMIDKANMQSCGNVVSLCGDRVDRIFTRFRGSVTVGRWTSHASSYRMTTGPSRMSCAHS